jgi:hypothetical protein
MSPAEILAGSDSARIDVDRDDLPRRTRQRNDSWRRGHTRRDFGDEVLDAASMASRQVTRDFVDERHERRAQWPVVAAVIQI